MTFLLFGSKQQQRVAKHLNAEHVVVSTRWHTSASKFFSDDDLFKFRQATATKLDWPTRSKVSRRKERCAPFGNEMLKRIACQCANALPTRRQLLGQKGLHFFAILFRRCAVCRVHGF